MLPIEAVPPHPQVIMPETCLHCKKRVRFGKMVVKCRDCRVVAHPECQQELGESCLPMVKSNLNVAQV